MKSPIDNFSLLSYPTGTVTQFFGENPKLYAFMGLAGHNGIDIVAAHGSPLYAVEDGEVADVKNDPAGFGKHIRFLTNNREWTYGHCHEIMVKIGDKVVAGQQIATMGNTGFVVSGASPFWEYNPYAGTHLHLGLRMIKRTRSGWSYAGSNVKFDVLNYNNGFKGAIDPLPVLVAIGTPPPDAKQQKMITLISLLNTLKGLLKDKRKA